MTSHDVEGEFGAVKDDLAKLRADIANLSAALKGLTSETVHDQIDSLKGRLDRLTHDAKDQGRQALDDLGDHIEERPGSSGRIAFGVGILIGRLFDRSRRRRPPQPTKCIDERSRRLSAAER